MLTTEQCIEIAEKVWGYKREKAYHGDHYLPSFVKGNLEPIAERDIEDEVNSWQGFGRTVEAMAEKSVYLKSSFHDKLKAHFAQYLIDTSSDKLSGLFEMSHLAALEGINDNQ